MAFHESAYCLIVVLDVGDDLAVGVAQPLLAV
jgi:hypothetical protein